MKPGFWFLTCLILAVMLPILGCSGSHEPVNKGADRPVPPAKKTKDK